MLTSTKCKTLMVVYEIKERLDEHGLYDDKDLAAFKEARFKTIRDITHTKSPQHKAPIPPLLERRPCITTR